MQYYGDARENMGSSHGEREASSASNREDTEWDVRTAHLSRDYTLQIASG